MSVVFRLDPVEAQPTLADLEAAFVRPARPLFLGRKSCLPAAPIFQGYVVAAYARAALSAVAANTPGTFRALWPATEGTFDADRTFYLTDERKWLTGLHGGAREVCEGRVVTATSYG